ncbi:hypothetical protein M9458_047342, partial [Cirrhinus mrigala]
RACETRGEGTSDFGERARREPAQFDCGSAPGRGSGAPAAPEHPSAPARTERESASGRRGERAHRGRGRAGARGGRAGPGWAARCPLFGGKRADDERDVVQWAGQHPPRGGAGEQKRPGQAGRTDIQHRRAG